MALAGVELETLVSDPDTLTTRPPPCAPLYSLVLWKNPKRIRAQPCRSPPAKDNYAHKTA